LNILQYPENIKKAISLGNINIAQGRELSKCKDVQYRDALLERVIETGATSTTIKTWVYDPGIQSYIEHMDGNRIAGQAQTADMGIVRMDCGFCSENRPMSELRHIWLCPDCLLGLHEARRQNMLQGKEKNETEKNKNMS